MPIPLFVIAAALEAAAGGAQAIWGGKPSRERRRMLSRYKQRSEEGLTPQEESRMGVSYAPMISRGIQERQGRMAGAYAASGGAGSSYALRDIGGLPTVGESLAPIIAQQDMAAKSRAEDQYLGLQMETDAMRQSAKERGFALMGEAAGTALTGFAEKAKMVKRAKAFEKLGLPAEAADLNPEDMLMLSDYLKKPNARRDYMPTPSPSGLKWILQGQEEPEERMRRLPRGWLNWNQNQEQESMSPW